jgi:hypothetical protein
VSLKLSRITYIDEQDAPSAEKYRFERKRGDYQANYLDIQEIK